MAPENEEHIEAGEHEHGHPFYPHHVIDQMVILYVLIGVVVTLAVLLPFHLHEKADSLHTPIGIKPEWYFMPMYQFVKYVNKQLAFALMGIAGAVLVLWPFIDAAIERRAPGKRMHLRVGAVAFLLALGLGLVGWACERNVTVLGKRYHIDLLGVPHAISAAEDSESHDASH